VSVTRLQSSLTLRPVILLPPKRLLTPRSARQISPTNRGLLLSVPVPTQTGLTPAGLIQLAGRTKVGPYDGHSTNAHAYGDVSLLGTVFR